MILDKTFCSGLRCSETEARDRYEGKLKEYMKKVKWIDWESRVVSISNFSDHEENCEPIELRKDKVRLECMIINQHIKFKQYDPYFEGGWIYSKDNSHKGYFKTFRDAIDDAMKEV